MNTATMEDKIYSFIVAHGGGVTFAELEHIEGFKGDFDQEFSDRNIVIWTGLSQEASAAIIALVQSGKIEPCPTPVLTYMIDGKILDLPVANQIRRKYKKPHWLPVVYNVGRGN